MMLSYLAQVSRNTSNVLHLSLTDKGYRPKVESYKVPFHAGTSEASFDTLKSKLNTPPILAFPRFTDSFVVSTDASDRAIGGVLSQMQDGHERVE